MVPCGRAFVAGQTGGGTPLIIASVYGNVKLVRALVKAGAVVDQAVVREDRVAVGVGLCKCGGCESQLVCAVMCVSFGARSLGADAKHGVPSPLMLN